MSAPANDFQTLGRRERIRQESESAAWFADPTNDTIPDLEFPYPPCPICDRETDHDGDSFGCDVCEVWWSQGGTSGERMKS